MEIPRFPPGTSSTPLGFEARVMMVPVVPDEIIGSDSDVRVLMFWFRTLILLVPVRKRSV